MAEAEARVIGWSTIVLRGEVYWLDDLWIEPMWMGRGVGSQLFRHACARAKAGATRLEWEAEPNALGFYERMGARYVRDGEPTGFGRVLRVMSVEL